jgi:hypothetical protein
MDGTAGEFFVYPVITRMLVLLFYESAGFRLHEFIAV